MRVREGGGVGEMGVGVRVVGTCAVDVVHMCGGLMIHVDEYVWYVW